ncbi:hypothetical protein ABKV19_006418 [Rosa sericea]
MEGRKLNFSAPLLSVRRISATPVSTNADTGKVTPRLANGRHTLPLPKSDFSLEQVTKPVAVPFHWEDIPGRSKEGEELKIQSREAASVTPRLPPGKIVDGKKKPLEKERADQKAITPYLKSYSSNENAMEAKCSKERVIERRASKFEDEVDVYSDAQETLSPPTESFSMNCSATGTNQSHSANVQPSIDPQTRDFMMKRFLPAAKAMALETPHVALKKQQYSAPLEQPRQVTRVIRQETSPLPNQQRSHMELVLYSQYKEEEESEGEVDEYDQPGYISPKGCGLFPRLGLRNSLCPLPVPAMKAKARALMSCSSSVAIPGKTTHSRSHSPLKQVIKTTNSQSHSQPLNKVIKPAKIQSHSQPFNKVIKPANSQSHCQPLNKRDQGAAYNLKVDRGFYSGELPRLMNNQAAQSIQFRHSGEQPKGRSSPFRQSRSPCISPYRNERPKSPFTGAGFLGVPKEENVKANSSKFNMNDKVGHKSQEVLSHQRNKQGPYTVIPMIEKTLYVDTVNTTKTSCLSSSSLYTKERVDSAVEDLRTLLKRSGMEETSAGESLFQDIKRLTNFESNGISEPAALESVEDSLSSFSDISHIKGQVVAVEDSQLGLDMRSDDIMKEDPGNANTIVVQSPLPPPLPKSPSQSWLSSTLSSIPSRNSVSSGSKRHTKRSGSKTSSTGTKWETIVKTSNLHHDHVRYSEELITHACQQSKS